MTVIGYNLIKEFVSKFAHLVAEGCNIKCLIIWNPREEFGIRERQRRKTKSLYSCFVEHVFADVAVVFPKLSTI